MTSTITKNSIQKWLYELRAEYKLYAAGVLFVLLSTLISNILPSHKTTPHGLLFLASIAFSVGFLMWGRWTFQKTWEHPIGRGAIIILHLFVVLISAIMARSLVAAALGLPPQDFDIAVAFIAFAMYIPTWALVISCVLGILGFLLSLFGTFFTAVYLPARDVAKTLARGAGAFAICMYTYAAFDFVNKNQEALYPVAKWAAWLGDFHSVPAYPGIKDNERVRLLENGVVSIVTIEHNTVVIRTRMYAQ